MESTLHHQLKQRFGSEGGGRSEVEVLVAGFRVDAVDTEGRLVEVQSGALGPLREKLVRLLPEHRMRVIKPVVIDRKVIRRARPEGPDLSARRSPKRGQALDVFDDLVGLASVFPHPNLLVDVLAVTIDEIRTPRRRRPGYTVADRQLRSVLSSTSLCDAYDLWNLIPPGLASPFTSLELADHLGRSMDFAQRVAYCLRLSGAAAQVGKRGNRLVYVDKRTSVQAGWTSKTTLRAVARL
ncbi:MAG TPA: hypothetical protein VGZ22_22195 [Isosphaeraceae bacterium]|jgi:hypothetical protein|nr:hypothetical protein [Isosphaeraceae bacterium]